MTRTPFVGQRYNLLVYISTCSEILVITKKVITHVKKKIARIMVRIHVQESANNRMRRDKKKSLQVDNASAEFVGLSEGLQL